MRYLDNPPSWLVRLISVMERILDWTWWLLPLSAALLVFDVWWSWYAGEPAAISNVVLAALVACWVWLSTIERRPF